jgi:hypothetical protein
VCHGRCEQGDRARAPGKGSRGSELPEWREGREPAPRTSERYKDREGNQQERTEWHAVAIFNEKLGEIAEKYLKKGNEVYIEGQLETRKWQDAQGQEKYTTEIVLRQFAAS